MQIKKLSFLFIFLGLIIHITLADPVLNENPENDDDIPAEQFFFIEELFIDEGAFFLIYDELSEELNNGENTINEEEFFDEEEPQTEDHHIAEEEFDFNPNDFIFDAPDLIFEVPVYEMRSLDTIFPNFNEIQRMFALSPRGLRNYFLRNEPPTLVPNPELEIDLISMIMKINPSHIIEAMVVVPYNEKELDLLDVYNALGRIENIKDFSVYINEIEFFPFSESTRIEGRRNRRAIPDPSPAGNLPFSETMFIRLKEYNFGNLFLRGEISISMYGITYYITNFIDVRYLLIPLVRAERYATIIYLEPITEGVLVYSVTGFFIPNFIADRVNLTPNINRRIEVFIKWITDGLLRQGLEEESTDYTDYTD